MTIFDEARVTVLLADHIAVDAGGGKITALGLGFTVTGVDPRTGLTPPQAVGVLIDVPRRFAGQTVSIAIGLRDITNDHAVKVPGPTGKPEALRVQSLISIQPPVVPGVLLNDDMFCRIQSVLQFQNGLPLQAGTEYAWRVEIEDRTRPGWKAHFTVARPAPEPVLGGPAGPTDIPGVAHVETVEEEPEEETDAG